jgi:hypothetical protein
MCRHRFRQVSVAAARHTTLYYEVSSTCGAYEQLLHSAATSNTVTWQLLLT